MAVGDNCTLNAPNYGSVKVRAVSVSHGLHIIHQEGEARFYRAIYLDKRTPAPFSIGLVFSNHDDYQKFGNWLRGWGDAVANPDFAGGRPTGPMRVTVPAIDFDRYGVFTTGVTFGKAVAETSWRMMLSFQNAREAGTDGGVNNIQSHFVDVPQSENLAPTYFYPAGKQLTGSAQGLDFLYDEKNSGETLSSTVGKGPAAPLQTGPRPGGVIEH